jgi:hypothetical protein
LYARPLPSSRPAPPVKNQSDTPLLLEDLCSKSHAVCDMPAKAEAEAIAILIAIATLKSLMILLIFSSLFTSNSKS